MQTKFSACHVKIVVFRLLLTLVRQLTPALANFYLCRRDLWLYCRLCRDIDHQGAVVWYSRGVQGSRRRHRQAMFCPETALNLKLPLKPVEEQEEYG
jgi:hypothetical protein